MQNNQLKNTELRISKLGLGSVNFGTDTSAVDAELQLDAFLDMGGNLIDSANVYGDWASDVPSISEKIIGDWLKKSGKRDKLIISTKGAHPSLDAMHIPRCSASDIKADLDASLQNLRCDYIDLYFLHRDDVDMPVEVIIDCLEDAVKQGKIRYYGCSNWSLARIMEAQAYAEKVNCTGFVCNQLMWSLADINASGVHDKTLVLMDEKTYAYHKESGLGAMAYSAAAKGYFSKRFEGSKLSDKISERYLNPTNDRIYEELLRLNKESGISLNCLSLLYFVSQPFTSSALVSFSKLEQLKDCSAIFSENGQEVEALGRLKKFIHEG